MEDNVPFMSNFPCLHLHSETFLDLSLSVNKVDARIADETPKLVGVQIFLAEKMKEPMVWHSVAMTPAGLNVCL